jgi:hypothetical protein
VTIPPSEKKPIKRGTKKIREINLYALKKPITQPVANNAIKIAIRIRFPM